jgi:four helix bundle protein
LKLTKSFSFQKLRVWDEAMQLLRLIYKVSSTFPSTEKFGLISQMRRCSVSILSNIAEGNSRFSQKERARFFEVAYSSTVELQAQIVISQEIELINNDSFLELVETTQIITRMLNGLHKSQQKY